MDRVRSSNFGFLIRTFKNPYVLATTIGILLSLSNPAIAQLDRNWRREIEWAATLLAGSNKCGFGRPIKDRFARAVGLYMRDHTPPSESMDYYAEAYVAPWREMERKGVDCTKIRSSMEKFIKKHGYREDWR